MHIIFEDEALRELYETGYSRKYKKFSLNPPKVQAYIEIIDLLSNISAAFNIKDFSSLHYEKLKHNYSGFSSVRIMNGAIERLIFREEEDTITISLIEINENHYGNK